MGLLGHAIPNPDEPREERLGLSQVAQGEISPHEGLLGGLRGLLRISKMHTEPPHQRSLVSVDQETKRLRVAVETGTYALFIRW